jgi:hypothetical protein
LFYRGGRGKKQPNGKHTRTQIEQIEQISFFFPTEILKPKKFKQEEVHESKRDDTNSVGHTHTQISSEKSEKKKKKRIFDTVTGHIHTHTRARSRSRKNCAAEFSENSRPVIFLSFSS